MQVVSIVGMTGAGKSEVAKVFEENGFVRVRFGDITDKEIKKRGLELNERNERYIREELRKEKKWREADEVRKEIENLGFSVEDSKDGSAIEFARGPLANGSGSI